MRIFKKILGHFLKNTDPKDQEKRYIPNKSQNSKKTNSNKKVEVNKGFQKYFTNKYIKTYFVIFFLIILIVIVKLFIIGLPWPIERTQDDNAYAVQREEFAKCLASSGAIMFGVDTCPNCQQQKKLFGTSFTEINYVNCDFDKLICQENNIYFYPIWKINGNLALGYQSFDQLAKLTNCIAPKI